MTGRGAEEAGRAVQRGVRQGPRQQRPHRTDPESSLSISPRPFQFFLSVLFSDPAPVHATHAVRPCVGGGRGGNVRGSCTAWEVSTACYYHGVSLASATLSLKIVMHASIFCQVLRLL